MHWLSAALAASLVVPIAVPLLRKRHACLLTVVWNFAVFVAMYAGDLARPGTYLQVAYDLGWDTALMGDPAQWYRALTAMYVHAGALHILMNMLILVLVGVPFEDRVGTGRWLAIYLATGVIGGAVDQGFAIATHSGHVGIGASGAIFGVMGAFAYMYPRDEIPMMLGFIFLQRVPVVWAVVFMGILETLYLLGANDNIGHIVHVASLLAGIALGAPFGLQMRKAAAGRPGAAMDLEALHGLVRDEETAELYDKIYKEEIPEVRQAWLEQYIKKARCPNCRKMLAHAPGRFFCSCGFKLQYAR